MRKLKVVCAVYSHPEFYPPTLNAVSCLAPICKKISIVCRNVWQPKWEYPKNVKLVHSGPLTDIRATERKSSMWKFFSFLSLTYTLYRTIKKSKPDWVILYDPIPLLAYFLISKVSFTRVKVWYHNHDVIEIKHVRKYSISWWARKSENYSLKMVDLFTLPSNERKLFYKISKFKGLFFILPNLPTRLASHTRKRDIYLNKVIRLLYQGTVSTGHGIEAFISILNEKINGFDLNLTLIGKISDEYKKELVKLAVEKHVSSKLFIIEYLPYGQLLQETSKYDIGLAVHEPVNIAFQTAATASNKIYEYVSNGLPVILYNSNHYTDYLKEYSWAFFTDLSSKSIKGILGDIEQYYEQISADAYNDFQAKLNYEFYFENVKKALY